MVGVLIGASLVEIIVLLTAVYACHRATFGAFLAEVTVRVGTVDRSCFGFLWK